MAAMMTMTRARTVPITPIVPAWPMILEAQSLCLAVHVNEAGFTEVGYKGKTTSSD